MSIPGFLSKFGFCLLKWVLGMGNPTDIFYWKAGGTLLFQRPFGAPLSLLAHLQPKLLCTVCKVSVILVCVAGGGVILNCLICY